MARHLITPGARARLRAVVAEDADHYELLDRRLVGRLAGFLYCCAGLIAIALLGLNPPTQAIGGLGWVPAATITALAFLFGVGMVVNQRILGTRLLLAIALSGPVMLATLQWLAGSGSAYMQIIILSVVWCGVVLSGPRLALVLVADTAMVFLPAAYGDWNGALLPERIATTALAWVLGFVCLVYAARQRAIRRGLRAQRQAADDLARVDELTGLGNRRALDEALDVQVALAERTGRPLAALVADLDRFKDINDLYGHQAGDVLLRRVAGVLRDVVRIPDACFRWGGDEFVIVLPGSDRVTAEEVLDRMAEAVPAVCETEDGRPVTLTYGCAEFEEGMTMDDAMALADLSLLGNKPARRDLS
jgi:diguanylate cyclase (GGDEF)-like protein